MSHIQGERERETEEIKDGEEEMGKARKREGKREEGERKELHAHCTRRERIGVGREGKREGERVMEGGEGGEVGEMDTRAHRGIEREREYLKG